MRAIFLRELKSYFTSATAYLFAAFVLIFVGIFIMVDNLSQSAAYFEWAIQDCSIVLLLGIPILTMRVISEEKRQKTDQLLYSLPMSLFKVVMGKYFALLAVIALPCVFMGVYPFVLRLYGPISVSASFCMLAAFFLLSASLAAIGMFISSISENQIVAAVISVVVFLLLYFMGTLAAFVPSTGIASLFGLIGLALVFGLMFYLFTKNLPVAAVLALVVCAGLVAYYSAQPNAFINLFPSIMQNISLFDRYDEFVNCIFDLTSVFYFISVAGVFLFLTVQTLEKRRWSE